jgi:hypothetical protein
MIQDRLAINPTPHVVIVRIRVQDASECTRRKVRKKPVIAIQNPTSMTVAIKPASHVR